MLQYELPLEKKKYFRITLKGNVILSSKKLGDQWFMTQSGSIVKMKCATEVNGIFKVIGQPLIDKRDFFINPIKSSYLSIYQSDGDITSELFDYDIASISAKMICLNYESEYVYMPLLHTLKCFINSV